MKKGFIDPDDWLTRDLKEFCRTHQSDGSQVIYLPLARDAKYRRFISEGTRLAWEDPALLEKKRLALQKAWADGKYSNRRPRKPGSGRKRQPCTVDGVRVFESVSELRKELGQGKKGTRNPNFTLVKRD